MKKDSVIYIVHIRECIERILSYTEEIDSDAFMDDFLVQDAVIRNLEVIGEAVKNLDMEFRLKYNSIEWKKIAGMRDKLIHDYIGVDVRAVWGVVEEILPGFHHQIQEILKIEKFE